MRDEPPQLELLLGPGDDDVATWPFAPARLTQARFLAGRTKRELAEVVGVSPAAVGQYEAGLTAPRRELVPALAAALGVEPRFFAAGRPYLRVDSGEAHFRSLRSMRAADRGRALAKAEQVWELTCALERHVQLPEVDLPALPGVPTPREAARHLRQHWALSQGPIRHLVATMEAHGVVVLVIGLGHLERVEAFSTVVADRPIVISTPRRSDDVYRHRFTCAHELGHLLLHRGSAPGDVALEHEADEFAAEFLTPAAELKSLLPERMDLGTLDSLSRTWGVSVESLVLRMGELRKVSDATVRRAFQRLNVLRESRTHESLHRYAGESPRMLREAVRLCEGPGQTTLSELAAGLCWKPARLRELLGIDDPRPRLTLVPQSAQPRRLP